MSLTNPNKVITEERLSEFYQSIFPYLGGMPDILANKFNKSDLYSTSEKMIGQWIDGKPLYQKTITFDTLTVRVNNFISHNIQNVDTIYPIGGFVKLSSGAYVPVPRLSPDNSNYDVWNLSITDFDTTQFVIRVGSGYTGTSAAITSGCVTLQYTKTTDSTVSIGNDTDYSTTEKIVGTWIDGKPIYQKTFVDIITVDSSNLNISYSHNISNVDVVVGCYGVYRNADNTNKATIPIMWDGQSAVISANRTNISLLRTNVNFIQTCVVSATIQYTKTTD